MARTQKYSEDQLLEAVIKYSEIEKKKIKATELAEWCRSNVKGLEEVNYYHFLRPVKEHDVKTGKMIERVKLCTKKIDEINRARDLTKSVNANLLLRASNLETFFQQPDIVQRKIVVETRNLFDEIVSKNVLLTKTNEALRAENKSIKANIENITEKIVTLEKEQKILLRQVTHLMKSVDEDRRKEMLSRMGLEDYLFDGKKYGDSLKQNLNEIMDINATLRQYIDENKETKPKTNLVDDVLSGIDF